MFAIGFGCRRKEYHEWSESCGYDEMEMTFPF